MKKCERCGKQSKLLNSAIMDGKIVFDSLCTNCFFELKTSQKEYKGLRMPIVTWKIELEKEPWCKYNNNKDIKQLTEEFKVLRKQGLVHLNERLYYKTGKEIRESESILALSALTRDYMGYVIFTDKRILLRPLYEKGKPLKDIFYDKIDKESIGIDSESVYFKHENEIYYIHNLKKYLLNKLLEDMIQKEIVANKNEITTISQEKSREIEERGNKIDAISLYHIDGIPFLGGDEVKLELYEDRLNIIDMNKNKSYKIVLENILNMKIKKESEITEKERHTILRAIGGGILFGPLGAIIGGMSGVPHKLKKTENIFLTLDYKSKDGENKSVFFVQDPKNRFASPGLKGFLDIAIKQIGLTQPLEENEEGEIEL